LDDFTDLSVDGGHGIESMRSFLQTMMHGLGGVTPPFPHRVIRLSHKMGGDSHPLKVGVVSFDWRILQRPDFLKIGLDPILDTFAGWA